MNFGTKIRTALLAAASINLIFYTATHFGIWAVITLLSTLIISWICWYYNEDLTEDACIGTGLTRQRKMERKVDYVGDVFFENFDDEEADLEEGENE